MTLPSHIPAFSLPTSCADHPLVANRLFYKLPLRLLDALEKEARLSQIDPQLLDLERQISRATATGRYNAGVWHSEPLAYRMLERPSSVIFDEASLVTLGDWRNQPEWQKVLSNPNREDAAAVLGRFRIQSRGYCGWLLSNPEFLKEHDEFFGRYLATIRAQRPPRVGLPAGVEIKHSVTADEEQVRCIADFSRLLRRWQLLDLPGPYLPDPLEPQTVDLLPGQERPSTTTISWPKYMPLPDRDTLRKLLDYAHACEADRKHMHDWNAILSNRSAAHSSIERYSRLFELRHYWLVLHRRWGDRLKRQGERLKYAFADFLFDPANALDAGKRDIVHRDLQIIARRLGNKDWLVVS